MTYSVNQARHLYGAESLTSDNTRVANGDLYFMFKYADGIEERSDLIPLKNIEYVKYSKANAYKPARKKITVTPPASMDAAITTVLHIEVCNIAGFGDEETYMYSVPVTNATTNSAWVEKALTEISKIEKRARMGGINNLGFKATGTTTLVIESVLDKETPEVIHRVNTKFPLIRAWFTDDVIAETVDSKGMHEYTYSATDLRETKTATFKLHDGWNNASIPNGTEVRAMEYFYHKERGDLYGGMLYPNDIPFTSRLKASADDKFDLIDIHYFYAGPNEDVQKSGKDITIAVTAGGSVSVLTDALIEKGINVQVNDGGTVKSKADSNASAASPVIKDITE